MPRTRLSLFFFFALFAFALSARAGEVVLY